MKTHLVSVAAAAGIVLASVIACQSGASSKAGSEVKSPVDVGAGGTTSAATAAPVTVATGGTVATTGATVAGGTANAQTGASVPPVASKVTMAGVKILVPGILVFETGKATLGATAGNDALLEELRLFLVQNPKVTQLRIEGHTDNVGKPDENLEMSGQRAITIKNWLVQKGIAKERLLAVGFGDQKPLKDNSTEAGREQNRRTEFKVAGWEGRNYLGREPKGGGKEF